jgi:hypothetical protein
MQADASMLLTSAKLEALITSSHPIKGIFWDMVWPQLAKWGWTSDLVPMKSSGCIFFPPCDSNGQPEPLDSIQVPNLLHLMCWRVMMFLCCLHVEQMWILTPQHLDN